MGGGGGGAANWWGMGGGMTWPCADIIARDGVGAAESFSRRDSIVANFTTSFSTVVSSWSSLLVFSWTVNSRSNESTLILLVHIHLNRSTTGTYYALP